VLQLNRFSSEIRPSTPPGSSRYSSSSVISLGIKWRRPDVEVSEIGDINKLIAGLACLGLGSKGGGCRGEAVVEGIVFDQ